jgi:hypothetical protein
VPFYAYFLTPLALFALLAGGATLFWAGVLAQRAWFFLFGTLLTLGVHALVLAMMKVYDFINPISQVIYGTKQTGTPDPSAWGRYASLFDAKDLIALGTALMLSLPLLMVLRAALSPRGVA